MPVLRAASVRVHNVILNLPTSSFASNGLRIILADLAWPPVVSDRGPCKQSFEGVVQVEGMSFKLPNFFYQLPLRDFFFLLDFGGSGRDTEPPAASASIPPPCSIFVLASRKNMTSLT